MIAPRLSPDTVVLIGAQGHSRGAAADALPTLFPVDPYQYTQRDMDVPPPAVFKDANAGIEAGSVENTCKGRIEVEGASTVPAEQKLQVDTHAHIAARTGPALSAFAEAISLPLLRYPMPKLIVDGHPPMESEKPQRVRESILVKDLREDHVQIKSDHEVTIVLHADQAEHLGIIRAAPVGPPIKQAICNFLTKTHPGKHRPEGPPQQYYTFYDH